MNTSFLNVHMREEKKMMTRKRRTTTRRKIRNSSIRSPMEKHTLDKSESQMMRALNRKVVTWKPHPSRENLPQASHSSPTFPSTLASWKRRVKRR
jgi:hypothetical protein